MNKASLEPLKTVSIALLISLNYKAYMLVLLRYYIT